MCTATPSFCPAFRRAQLELCPSGSALGGRGVLCDHEKGCCAFHLIHQRLKPNPESTARQPDSCTGLPILFPDTIIFSHPVKGLTSPTLTTEFRFQFSEKGKTGVPPTKGHLSTTPLHSEKRPEPASQCLKDKSSSPS